MYDLFFLSYEEPFADDDWQKFKARFPHAKRVHGVKGILAAHQACARKSFTSHFFVTDADNEVLPWFNFDYKVGEYDANYVHLWYATNPVNNLEYGWGGLKLFPKRMVLGASAMTSDMTTSFPLKIIPEVASITRFNKTEFDSWRSAFREAAKLTRSGFKNGNSKEDEDRLNTWKTVGVSKRNGAWVIDGACEGSLFAKSHDDITCVNDWGWLQERFYARFPEMKKEG
jgi:hypothetical protein